MWIANDHHISTWSDVARHGEQSHWGSVTTYGLDFMSTGGYVGIVEFSVSTFDTRYSSVHHIILLPDFDFVQVSVNDDPSTPVVAVANPGYTRRLHQWKEQVHPALSWDLNLFLAALAVYGLENHKEMVELCG